MQKQTHLAPILPAPQRGIEQDTPRALAQNSKMMLFRFAEQITLTLRHKTGIQTRRRAGLVRFRSKSGDSPAAVNLLQ